MQKILGDAKSVKSLLSQKYQIDYYQRDYNWEKKQVVELIEDLSTRFLQDFDESHPRTEVANYGLYFLGSIIISEKSGDRYIVDGQQRLTSLTLLLIYLDHLQRETPVEELVAITHLIYSTQYGANSFNLNVEERNPCLQLLTNGEVPDTTDQPASVQNIVYRYNDIADSFPNDLKEHALPYFLDWLTEKVTLVEITASSDDDAYTIFETMNDRGLSLTPTDMLKGYLLANITSVNDSRIRAGDTWKEQTDVLRRELGKDGDADCIKDWLRSQYADKIRERRKGAVPEDFEKISTEFHRWVRDNKDRIGLTDNETFTSFVSNDLRFFAHAYIFARSKANTYDSDFGSILFNHHNSFTLQYPLMLAPMRLNDNQETVQRKMRLVSTFLEILLARRMWNFRDISYSTMQYRAFLIMKSIRGMELEQLREELVKQLSPERVEGAEIVDFEASEPFRMHGRNGPQVHRLLARLTEFIEVESGRNSRYAEYSNRSRYQIEHLWANHPERHEDEFSHTQDFSAYRDRIGGLVLVPSRDNASYSDMLYKDKVEHYTKQNLLASSLHSIAYENDPGFHKFREETGFPFGPKPEFRRADLDDRQALYAALANLCWSPERLNKI